MEICLVSDLIGDLGPGFLALLACTLTFSPVLRKLPTVYTHPSVLSCLALARQLASSLTKWHVQTLQPVRRHLNLPFGRPFLCPLPPRIFLQPSPPASSSLPLIISLSSVSPLSFSSRERRQGLRRRWRYIERESVCVVHVGGFTAIGKLFTAVCSHVLLL